jgi:uncharacterized membrane protein
MYPEHALLMLTLLAVVTLLFIVFVSRTGSRSESYSFILLGPLPIFLKGRGAVVASITIFLLILLVLVMLL